MLTDSTLVPSVAESTLDPAMVPTGVVIETLSPQRTVADVLSLVTEAGELVGGVDLGDRARWAAADVAVAATAATLRIAAVKLAEAAGPQSRVGRIDTAPVDPAAPPVVRAREIGFLASSLAATLERVDKDEPAVASLLTAVAERLRGDLRMLRHVSGSDPSTPRHERPWSAILPKRKRTNRRRTWSRS